MHNNPLYTYIPAIYSTRENLSGQVVPALLDTEAYKALDMQSSTPRYTRTMQCLKSMAIHTTGGKGKRPAHSSLIRQRAAQVVCTPTLMTKQTDNLRKSESTTACALHSINHLGPNLANSSRREQGRLVIWLPSSMPRGAIVKRCKIDRQTKQNDPGWSAHIPHSTPWTLLHSDSSSSALAAG